ncbi:SH3 domain-containing protein C23A1.17-like, partial [Penaeus chinensis]|uniref:SH3 domain-containing protein C23A1.17-like n=1 Tax=Penaeus chinensis TaxID=139456 RepID=UPI001FB7259E
FLTVRSLSSDSRAAGGGGHRPPPEVAEVLPEEVQQRDRRPEVHLHRVRRRPGRAADCPRRARPPWTSFRRLPPTTPTSSRRRRTPSCPLKAPQPTSECLRPWSATPSSPRPSDTYSDPAGVPHGELLPPPAVAVIPADQSYVSYENVGQVSLVPPAPYSYAHLPADASGADVLASLASMVQVLPSDSSYTSYEPISAGEDSLLPTSLVPPAVESPAAPTSSSYSEVPEAQPELTQEEIRRAETAQAPIPSRALQPPPRT